MEEAKILGYEGGEVFFDSDEESEDEDEDQDEFLNDEDGRRIEDKRPHDCPNSYAWILIRLALTVHMKSRLTQFLLITGFDFIGNYFIQCVLKS